jgi:hypothetical protein
VQPRELDAEKYAVDYCKKVFKPFKFMLNVEKSLDDRFEDKLLADKYLAKREAEKGKEKE